MDPSLTTEDKYKGIKVVPSNMPDEEVEGAVIHVSREAEAQKKVPVFAYPPELLGQDYSTHPTAGIGESFMLEGQGSDQKFVGGSKHVLRRTGDVLPEGFFNTIHAVHGGKAEVKMKGAIPMRAPG